MLMPVLPGSRSLPGWIVAARSRRACLAAAKFRDHEQAFLCTDLGTDPQKALSMAQSAIDLGNQAPKPTMRSRKRVSEVQGALKSEYQQLRAC